MSKFKIVVIIMLTCLIGIAGGIFIFFTVDIDKMSDKSSTLLTVSIEEEQTDEIEETENLSEVYALIKRTLDNEHHISELTEQLTKATVDKDYAQAYMYVEKIKYYCDDMMAIEFNDIESEYYDYFTYCKGYAETSVKSAEVNAFIISEANRPHIHSAVSKSVDYIVEREEFFSKMCETLDSIIEPLVDRKGMREESDRILNNLRSGKPHKEDYRKMWEKIAADSDDCSELELIMIENQLR